MINKNLIRIILGTLLLVLIAISPIYSENESDRSFSKIVYPDQDNSLEFEGVILWIPKGSVDIETTIKISRLDNTHTMNNSLENVTTGAASYRFEPAGTVFKKNIQVVIPFNEELLESETALSNLFTYFYDKDLKRWERLPRLNIDRENHKVVSLTTHFTDMITATLKMPESPEPLDFNINSIKNLEVMNPAVGVSELKGLTPSNLGGASFHIPINIPHGRGGNTPNIALSYNSDSGNSWMGKGFDISVPSITIDGRFGLPKYTDDDTYIYEGEELILIANSGTKKIYKPRVEKSFKRIIKIQDSVSNYWEITDKNGIKEIYGELEGWIGPDRSNRDKTFIWYLTSKEDVNGNKITYNYDYDSINKFTYLKDISYSDYYKLVFNTSENRADRKETSRGRFPSKLTRLLDSVKIYYNGENFRSYNFTYISNMFGQTQLEKFQEVDGAGNVFYENKFEYEGLPEVKDSNGNIIGYNGFGSEPKTWNAVSSLDFPGINQTITAGVGANLSVGARVEYLTYVNFFKFKYKQAASISLSGGVNYSGTLSTSTLFDVNGDGLPDAVWKDGGSLKSFLNTGTGFDVSNPQSFSGIPELFNYSTQFGYNLGVSAVAGPVSGGISKKGDYIDGKSTFRDINGDGFIDFIKAEDKSYYKNDGGNFQSTKYNNSTETNVTPINVNLDDYLRSYYSQEPIRKWKAYNSGTIVVKQDVELIGSEISLDGLNATTYPNGSYPSTKIVLSGSTTSGTSNSVYNITSGEDIYFHMDSLIDPRGDDISWDIDISYTNINYFEDLKYSGTIELKSLINDSLPDLRLSELYNYTELEVDNSIEYSLKTDWRDYLTDNSINAIVELGLFIPSRIPLEQFEKIFNTASEGTEIVESEEFIPGGKTFLIDNYRYRPEFKDFIKVGDGANQTILDSLSVLTNTERAEIFYYKDFSGNNYVTDNSSNVKSYIKSAPTNVVEAAIEEYSIDSVIGTTYKDGSILLDNIYNEDGTTLIEVLKLIPNQDTYNLVTITNGNTTNISNSSITINNNILNITFNRGGIEHNYQLSKKDSLLKKIPKDIYNNIEILNKISNPLFSYPNYSVLTKEQFDDLKNSSLSDSDKLFIQNIYSQYPRLIEPIEDGITTGGTTTGGTTTGGVTLGGTSTNITTDEHGNLIAGETIGGITTGGETREGVTIGGITVDQLSIRSETGGSTTGGLTIGGETTGGTTVGGILTGGETIEGINTGGVVTGGTTTGGITTGGETTGGITTFEPPTPQYYDLVTEVKDADMIKLLLIFDSLSNNEDSVLDTPYFTENQTDIGIVALSKLEYETYFNVLPETIFNKVEDSENNEFYILKQNLSLEEKENLEYHLRIYHRDTKDFPYYEYNINNETYELKNTLTLTEKDIVIESFKTLNLGVYTELSRSLKYSWDISLPVSYNENIVGLEVDNQVPKGSEELDITGAGYVTIPTFNELGVRTFVKRFIYKFNSKKDFSTENLISSYPESIYYNGDPDNDNDNGYLRGTDFISSSTEDRIPEFIEMFSGGVSGWYLGTWTGYYDFDKTLIHKLPPTNTNATSENEIALPSYFTSMSQNIENGVIKTTNIGVDPKLELTTNDLTGDISSYSKLEFDSLGSPITVEYKFAAVIGKTFLHADRNGGDTFFNIPTGNSSMVGGKIGKLSGSRSESIGINGGISIGPLSGSASKNSGTSWQFQDILDMNGDRYPDIVSFNPNENGSTSFSVNHGTGEGFGSAETYNSIYKNLNYSHNLNYGFGVSSSSGGTPLLVNYDKSGKVSEITIGSPSDESSSGFGIPLNGTIGSSFNSQGFMDINGDGLPDHLSRSGSGNYYAGINTGNNSFTNAVNYGTGIDTSLYSLGGMDISDTAKGLSFSNSGSFGTSLSTDIGSVKIGTTFTASASRTSSQLLDMNGDGLVDQVIKISSEGFFRVKFNLGDTFSAKEVLIYRPNWDGWVTERASALSSLLDSGVDSLNSMNIPLVSDIGDAVSLPSFSGYKFGSILNPLAIEDALGFNSGVSIGLNAAMNIPLFWIELGIFKFGFSMTPSVNGSFAMSTTSLGMRDINGDGLPDHVLKSMGDKNLTAKINGMGRVGLLRKIYTPQGGIISIDYKREGNTVQMPQNQYVLSKVTRTDGLENDATKEGIHSYTNYYNYLDGFHDRNERKFYGFARVQTIKDDGSITTTEYENTNYYTRGLVEKSWSQDSYGTLLSESKNSYGSKQIVYSDKTSKNYYVEETTETKYDLTDSDTLEIKTLYKYDDLGNVIQMDQKGLTLDPTDDLVLKITYEAGNDETYLKSLPKTMSVTDYTGKVLRHRAGEYNNSGNLLSLKSYYDSLNFTEYTFTYDSYGNMLSVEDSLGYTKEFIYDTKVQSFITTINSFNRSKPTNIYVSSLTYDYRYGVELTQTDINGNVMTKSYDNFGRILSIKTPYDTGEVSAVEYTYETSSFPWKALTKNKVSFKDTDIETMDTFVIIDGLGRSITTAKEGEVYTTYNNKLGWNKSGYTVYDNLGRTVKTGQTVFEETLGIPTTESTPLRPTLTSYDPLNRPTSVTYPDGAKVKNRYEIDGNFNIATVTDPLGNITVTKTDIKGNIVKIEKYDNDKKLLTEVSYKYNAMGELLKVTDAKGSITSFNYDMLGRQVKIESPETGITEFIYNNAGQLIRKVDANLRKSGASINYYYDQFGRIQKVDYPFIKDTIYEYGDPGADYNRAGRLVKITDDSGTTENFYGKLGEVNKLIKTIDRLTPSTESKSATFEYQYDYQGRMENIKYPDGEVLTYTYNSGGAVVSLESKYGNLTTSFVNKIGYDEYGQRIFIEYGNGVTTNYSYDPNRRWLTSTVSKSGNTTLQNLEYSFDLMGNIIKVINIADKYKLEHNYEYDPLYQLTKGSGTFEDWEFGYKSEVSNYTQNFTYDNVGNILNKLSSNIVTPTSNNNDLNYELNYSYYSDKPKQAETIGNLWYLYDSNGNMIEERVGGHSQKVNNGLGTITTNGDVNILDRGIGLGRGTSTEETIYSRVYTWDEENRLRSTTDPNNTVQYRYDSSGMRTNKYSDQETLYFSKMWLLSDDYSDFRTSKNIYLGESKIATRLNMDKTGSTSYTKLNTYFYQTDHLGSSNIVTDFQGQVYEHLEYTPYGETWINKTEDYSNKIPYSFTGQEKDQETGLYYHSARYYNPKISRWISSDPKGFELIIPMDKEGQARQGFSIIESNNWYSYVSNNPVNYRDPTGLQEAIPALGPRNIEVMMVVHTFKMLQAFTKDLYEALSSESNKDMAKNMAILANPGISIFLMGVVAQKDIVNADTKQKQESGLPTIRIQIQDCTSGRSQKTLATTGGIVGSSTTGVLKGQALLGVITAELELKGVSNKMTKSPAFRAAMQKLQNDIVSSNGVPDGDNVLQQKFTYQGTEYRIDLDSYRGNGKNISE